MVWLEVPCEEIQLQSTRPSLTSYIFPFSVSPWCWKTALPAFGRFSVEHALHNNSRNLFINVYIIRTHRPLNGVRSFFSLESECWHSKKVIYSNTAFIK